MNILLNNNCPSGINSFSPPYRLSLYNTLHAAVLKRLGKKSWSCSTNVVQNVSFSSYYFKAINPVESFFFFFLIDANVTGIWSRGAKDEAGSVTPKETGAAVKMFFIQYAGFSSDPHLGRNDFEKWWEFSCTFDKAAFTPGHRVILFSRSRGGASKV